MEIQITLVLGERIEIQKSQADALSISCTEYNTNTPEERTWSNPILTMKWRWSSKEKITYSNYTSMLLWISPHDHMHQAISRAIH